MVVLTGVKVFALVTKGEFLFERDLLLYLEQYYRSVSAWKSDICV